MADNRALTPITGWSMTSANYIVPPTLEQTYPPPQPVYADGVPQPIYANAIPEHPPTIDKAIVNNLFEIASWMRHESTNARAKLAEEWARQNNYLQKIDKFEKELHKMAVANAKIEMLMSQEQVHAEVVRWRNESYRLYSVAEETRRDNVIMGVEIRKLRELLNISGASTQGPSSASTGASQDSCQPTSEAKRRCPDIRH